MKKHSFKLFLLPFALACAVSTSIHAVTPPAPPTPLAQADVAYDKHDYLTAISLYQRALADPALDTRQIGSIKSKIAMCKINLPPGTAASAAAATQPSTLRTPHAKPQPGEVRPLDIKELGNFDYNPERGGIPADVQQLSGLHVKLNGFMVLMRQSDKVTEFALVPSIFSCCFGAPPQVQHTILIHCPKDSPAAYSADMVVVDGILKVDEQREDGFTTNLFEVSAQSVKPAAVQLPATLLSGKKSVQPDLNSLK